MAHHKTIKKALLTRQEGFFNTSKDFLMKKSAIFHWRTARPSLARRPLSPLLRSMAAALFFMLLPGAALAAVLPDGDYLIQMADSDMAVVSSGTAPRERVSIQPGPSPQGVWRFEHLGNDYYKIYAMVRVMVLDSFESRHTVGVPVIIFPWHGHKNQRWKLVRKGPFFALINQETGFALDLKGNRHKAGNVFQGFPPNDSRGQLFRLTPIGDVEKMKKQKQETSRESKKEQEEYEFSNSPHPKDF